MEHTPEMSTNYGVCYVSSFVKEGLKLYFPETRKD